ncbi:MAG: hypothetical protein AAGA03_07180 [Planctomycetota bacterium]
MARSSFWLLFIASVALGSIGCEESGNQVIQPTEDYQLNEQESENKQKLDAMRSGGDRGEQR